MSIYRMLDMGFEPQIRQILEDYDMTANGNPTSSNSPNSPNNPVMALSGDRGEACARPLISALAVLFAHCLRCCHLGLQWM